MGNSRKLPHWIALAVMAMLCLYGITSLFEALSSAATGRAEAILIDVIGQRKVLEMPPAVFLHDRHTQALAREGKDCSTCHAETAAGHRGFMRSNEEEDPEKLEQLFHKNCFACHAEKDAGPREGQCRLCHDAKAAPVPAPVADQRGSRAFHAIHAGSKAIRGPAGSDTNCGACHHIYDAQLQKLIWRSGTEDSCAACHTAKADGRKPSLHTAIHAKCVWCHADIKATARTEAAAAQDTSAAAPASGPDTCAGCHSADPQLARQLPEALPRLMRGQPDTAVMVSEGNGENATAEARGMKPVLFNHKLHEDVAASCRTCHHTRIDACTACHTLEGSPEGRFITLDQAMHSPDSEHSCVGCHRRYVRKNTQCAGCHGALPAEPSACAVCHAAVPDIPPAADATAPKKAENSPDSSVSPVASRVAASPVAPGDVPEEVKIGSLSSEFEASYFPHRKIYETLLQGIGNNGMAAAFHASPTTLCAACHHHTPQAELLSPPKCASCHGNAGNQAAGDSARPALRAAYHQQCMACHERMQITKPAATDCAGCHTPLTGRR